MYEINIIKLDQTNLTVYYQLKYLGTTQKGPRQSFADVVLEIAACWSELERLGTMAIALVVIGTPE